MRLRRLAENMSQERDAWRTFGVRLMLSGGVLTFSVWATVRSHPEQDLPLWPAWIFAALGCIGLGLTVTTLLRLPPFRDPPGLTEMSEAYGGGETLYGASGSPQVQRNAAPNDHDRLWAGIAIAVIIMMVMALLWLLTSSTPL